MSDSMTSDLLIDSIKRRASVPESQSTYSPQDFLDFATEELRLGIAPAIMSVHEDFFLFEETTDLIANKNDYEIPSRAIGNKLRDVQYKPQPDTYMEMTRIGIGDRFNSSSSITSSGIKEYYIRNNKVVLNSTVGSVPSGELCFVYYIRPSKLVTEDRVGVISGINTTTGEITVSEIPDNFNTQIQYDFYKAESPYTILSINLSATTINPTTKTVKFAPADLPSELKIGDHLAQAGEAIIPQIPGELHVMLAQMVSCRILESQGDTQGLQNALLKLKQMEEAAGILVDNRIEDSPMKVVNRHSVLKASMSAKRSNRR